MSMVEVVDVNTRALMQLTLFCTNEQIEALNRGEAIEIIPSPGEGKAVRTNGDFTLEIVNSER